MTVEITNDHRAEVTDGWDELLKLVKKGLEDADLTIRNQESRPCYHWQARTFNLEGTAGCPASIVVGVDMLSRQRQSTLCPTVDVLPHGPVSYNNRPTSYTTDNQKQNANKAVARAKKLVDEDRRLHEEQKQRLAHVDKMKRLTDEELGDLSDILMSSTFSGKKPIRILSRGQNGGYTLRMEAFLPLEQVKGIVSALRLKRDPQKGSETVNTSQKRKSAD